MRNTFRRLGAVAVAALLASGCAVERAAAPAFETSEIERSSLLGLTGLLTTVTGVQRNVPLAAPITVKQTIGSAGGTLSIPAAGVTVVVPKGALSANTVITMTARAGSLVAYDFAPHGIKFAKPLQFSQTIKGTNATLLSSLSLGYYADPSLLGKATAAVSELIAGTLSLKLGTFTSTISHFSGYIVACRGGSLDAD